MNEFHILGHIVWCGILANVWQRWLAAVTVDSGGAATTAWSSEVCEQSWRRLTQEPAVSDSLQTILQRRRRKRVIFFGKFMKIISIITFTFPKLSRCVEINDLFWKSITLWVSFVLFSVERQRYPLTQWISLSHRMQFHDVFFVLFLSFWVSKYWGRFLL